MSGFLDCPTCRTTSGVAGCPAHGGYWGMPRPDPHDHDAAQAAWVLRETDHDDREAFMAGWDAASGEVERLREALEIISEGRHPDGHRGAVLVARAALGEEAEA